MVGMVNMVSLIFVDGKSPTALGLAQISITTFSFKHSLCSTS